MEYQFCILLEKIRLEYLIIKVNNCNVQRDFTLCWPQVGEMREDTAHEGPTRSPSLTPKAAKVAGAERSDWPVEASLDMSSEHVCTCD